MNMEKRVTTITIVPKGEPIFDERGFTVSIDDESGGEFVTIRNNDGPGEVRIDPSEWPILSEVITGLIEDCRSWSDRK